MVHLWLPRVRAGCRCARSGVDANADPGTSIAGNRMARWGGDAKSWPDRPKGDDRAGSPGLHPGLVELALQAAIAKGALGASRVCTHHALTNFDGDGACASGTYGFLVFKRFRTPCINGPSSLPVHVHLRHSCVSGL